MRTFIIRGVIFTSFLTTTLVLSVIYIPLPVKDSLFYSILDKHQLLISKKSPKLIFVGGSGIGTGLDSKQISETYKIDVVNMGIHGGLGLKYMLNDLKPFINDGDIIVAVPEYLNFEEDGEFIANGSLELLYILFDIYPEGKKYIGVMQWVHLLKFLPSYAARKLYYFALEIPLRIELRIRKFDLNSPNLTNEYGDFGRKDKEVVPFLPYTLQGKISVEVIYFLNQYNDYVKYKNAKLYFLYPGYGEASYNIGVSFINHLNDLLKNDLSFEVLSTPERYKFPDNLFFDTPYHLNKKGIDIRTRKIIEDLRSIISNDKDKVFQSYNK